MHLKSEQITHLNFMIMDQSWMLLIVINMGVYLDEYLTFSKTTEILAMAARRALGSMINKFKSINDMGYSTYSKLYESLVTPVIDYGSAIWGFKGYYCGQLWV